MVKRVCPICEQVMPGGHYCPVCRSFVKHPRVMNVDYFLNERHPAAEGSCEYHNPSGKNIPGKNIPGKKAHPSGPLRPGMGEQASRRASGAGSWQQGYPRSGVPGYGKMGGGSGQKQGGIAMVIVAIVLIMVFLNLILPFFLMVL